MMPFMHNSPANPRLLVNPGTVSMKVSQDLANIRPVILGAIVRGVDVDDALIKRLMEHQEKLHFALGEEGNEPQLEFMIYPKFLHLPC